MTPQRPDPGDLVSLMMNARHRWQSVYAECHEWVAPDLIASEGGPGSHVLKGLDHTADPPPAHLEARVKVWQDRKGRTRNERSGPLGVENSTVIVNGERWAITSGGERVRSSDTDAGRAGTFPIEQLLDSAPFIQFLDLATATPGTMGERSVWHIKGATDPIGPGRRGPFGVRGQFGVAIDAKDGFVVELRQFNEIGDTRRVQLLALEVNHPLDETLFEVP